MDVMGTSLYYNKLSSESIKLVHITSEIPLFIFVNKFLFVLTIRLSVVSLPDLLFFIVHGMSGTILCM